MAFLHLQAPRASMVPTGFPSASVMTKEGRYWSFGLITRSALIASTGLRRRGGWALAFSSQHA